MAGSVAATLVVGSQLSDLGRLDADVKATLFGVEHSRFEFAVVSLAVALATTVFVVAAAAWVQISSHLTLKELVTFPERPGRKILGRRVKGRVREAIEYDLRKRQGMSLVEVVASWGKARTREWALRKSLMAFSEKTGMVHVPRPSNGCSPTVTEMDWTSADDLTDAAGAILAARELHELSAAQQSALASLGNEAQVAYANAKKETDTRESLLAIAVDDASYLRMRLTFGMMLKYIVAATFLGGIAIGTFAWATHPPEEPTSGRVSVVAVPLSELTSLGGLVSSECDPSSLKVEVVVEGSVALVTASSDSDGSTCVLQPASVTDR